MHTTSLGAAALAMATAATIAIGCGDDDPIAAEDSSVIGHGLPGKKKIGDLTRDESLQFCEAFVSYAESELSGALVTRASCVIVAFLTAETELDEATCQRAVDACLNAPPSSGPPAACDALPPDAPDCSATVTEFETCLVSTTEVSRDFLQELTCDLAGRNAAELTLLLEKYNLPPADCNPVLKACPELFEGVTP